MGFLESRLTSVGTLGPRGVAPHPVIDCAKRGPVKQTSIAALTPAYSAADLDRDVARLVTGAYSSQYNKGVGAQSTWMITEKGRFALGVLKWPDAPFRGGCMVPESKAGIVVVSFARVAVTWRTALVWQSPLSGRIDGCISLSQDPWQASGTNPVEVSSLLQTEGHAAESLRNWQGGSTFRVRFRRTLHRGQRLGLSNLTDESTS